jgi:DNA-binding MarR family transcriptional regulator
MRMSDLADVTRSSPSRLSHAIGRLEQAGWVRRQLCSTDRRGWFAILTDDGLKALEAAAPRHDESIRTHLLDQLSPTELGQLRRISETLLAHLAEAGGVAGACREQPQPPAPARGASSRRAVTAAPAPGA